MLSWVSRSMWSRISSSRPSSARRRRFTASLLVGGSQDPTDRSSQRVPLARLDLQPTAALGGQAVELGLPIVLGSALVERNPSAPDETVQRRIERSLLHH